MCAKKYNIIYADPPWLYQFPGTRAEKHDDYPVMCTRDIANMPVSAIAEENSALLIWGIWPRLPDCLQVISAWGFEYKTVAFVWVKTTAGAMVDQYSFLPVSSFAEFFGDLPRVELFARSGGHGWDVWGNEVPCSIELGAQNTMESGSTAYNTGSTQAGVPASTRPTCQSPRRAGAADRWPNRRALT